jgi:hypothetical protein
MNRIRRRISILATVAIGLLALGAAPAFAERVPPGGISGHLRLSRLSAPAHLAVSGGMPGWEIALIAAGAALVAAFLAVLADRARSARRHESPHAA